ncbi:MAG: hypothetical protein GF364_10710 [Candidatus Lokiarchaeota archaeon]|nr:hypothetical protein [Candidatus Lokiarchaeota archaeon]
MENNIEGNKVNEAREVPTSIESTVETAVELNETEILRLEEELEDDIGLKDYEIDKINLESEYLFNKPEDIKKGVEMTKNIMGKVLAIVSVLFGIAFIPIGLFYRSPFLFLYLIPQLMIILWITLLSPIQHHTFRHDKYYLKYRANLEPGFKFFKAHLRDFKYQYLAVIYLLANAMVFCAIFDAAMLNTRILERMNEIIYDRGNYPDSLITSVLPCLVVIGVGVNVLGASLFRFYKKRDAITDKKIEDPLIRNILLISVILSIILLFIIGAAVSDHFETFFSNSENASNFLYIFDSDDPMYHGRSTTFLFYLVIFSGSLALGFLILLGITTAELALLRIIIRRNKNNMPPPEKNWEFKPVLERREKVRNDKNNARKAALLEIIATTMAMVVGMWLGLWFGSDEMFDIPALEYFGYAILGLGGLWVFFLSPVYHHLNDGRHWYPTEKERNWNYAFWDERGMGSARKYYGHVLRKKKRLVGWCLFWFILSMSFVFFDWEDIWKQKDIEGIIPDLADGIFDLNYITVAVVFVMTAMVIIGFIISIGYKQAQFKDSKFWMIFYKLFMVFILFCCFKWITTITHITSLVDVFSLDFLIAVLVVILFFGVVSLVAVLVFFPFLIKFENLHAPKGAILMITVNTLVLTAILVAVFHVVLPMTGLNGEEIAWPYPFNSGIEEEVHLLWQNDFWLGALFDEWAGRYIWWGALQQYLFMSYYLVLWQKVFPNSKGYIVSVGTSMIFGVIHAVDYPLMLFTGIAGLMWAYFWHKEYYDKKTGKVHRGNNLLLWGMVHGFGGSLMAIIIPFSMSVGPFNM